MPGEHGVWLSEPVEHDEPAGHSEHWALLPRPRSLLKLPAAHGSGADAPSGQKAPGVQLKHAVALLAFWKEPAGQFGHNLAPRSALAVPSGQGWHAAESLAPLTGWKVPSPHAMHPELLFRPFSPDQRPGSHGVQTDAEDAPGSSQ